MNNYLTILLPILVLIVTVKTIFIDPICTSCLGIDPSLVQTSYNQLKNASLTQISLPGFSLATIIVDLRHLNSIELIGNQKQIDLYFQVIDQDLQQTSTIPIRDLILGTNQYQLEATADLQLLIYFEIIDQIKAFEYLLWDSVSVNLSYSNNRIPEEESSFVMVVKSEDNINLPENKPDLTNMKNYYLENEYNASSFQFNNIIESNTYWSTDSQFAVPYFPYFSKCSGEGNMMNIMDILQNSTDCELIPIHQTKWISEFNFGSSAIADRCSVKRNCILTGQSDPTEYPDWITLPEGTSIFSISEYKIPWQTFSYDMDFHDDQLVSCVINNSMGSNTSDQYPLKVKLSMGYYQVSQTEKKIISCLVEYDLYVDSTQNFTYQLEIVSYPLTHTYIMLNFGFKWYVYMIVFVIIGVVGNVENLLMWIYHYFVADQRKDIKIKMYLRIIYELIKGTSFALILEIALILLVCLIMNGKIFQNVFIYNQDDSNSPRVLFDYLLEIPTKDYDSSEMQQLRSGRMGLAFIYIGSLVILLTSQYFIGKEKTQEDYKNCTILGRALKPLSWNRGRFLFATFLYIILMHYFIDFAYSNLYSQNIWLFILVMKVLQAILEEATNSVFGEVLPGLPLKIITDIIAFLNTVSASDLYDFLFSSLIDVAVTMVQKIYIFQLQNMLVDKIIEKSEEFNFFYNNLMNEQDVDDDGDLSNELNSQNSNEDQQNVFIMRESHQVQFIDEEVNQVYLWTKKQDEQRLIMNCTMTQKEKKLQKKYFEFLNREYRQQRQMLLHEKKEKTGEKQKYLKKQEENDQDNMEAAEIAEAQKQQAMERESIIFELLLDNMAMIYTFLVNPFILLIFWFTYDESALLDNYGIVYNTTVLYILSALVIGLFSVLNVILIFHILESYMKISFEEQINDLISRFNLRKVYWISQEEHLNQKIQNKLLGADHYCLSSQLFFILTVYVGAMILVVLGLAIIFQAEYNFFDDIATIPIILFWTLFLHVFIWSVEKVAIFMNVWNFKDFQKNQPTDNNFTHSNLYLIMDQRSLMKQSDETNQQNSQFKTQNIIFTPLEELPVFKKIFQNIDLQNEITPKFLTKQTNEFAKSLHDQQIVKSIEEPEKIEPKLSTLPKKNKWLFQQERLKIQPNEHRDQFLIAQNRIQVICQKLQPYFAKQAAKLEFSKKNSQFIKQHIEKILPLVESLPDLQDYRSYLTASLSSDKNVKTQVTQRSKKSDSKKQDESEQKFTLDPVISQILQYWLRETLKQRAKRILTGLEMESKSKKCIFCYETWGLYYGNGGICLKCGMEMSEFKKESAKESKENEILQRNRARLSNSKVPKMKKKKKQTKNGSNLNVIEEESNAEDENSFSDHSNDDSDSQIIRSNRKWHRD